MFRSIPIHYRHNYGSGITVSGCEREGPSIKIGVEVRCAWLMERENYGGNNRTATEEVAHRLTRQISNARTKALGQCCWTLKIRNSTRSGEP
jgi:hypothetical protein